MSAIGPGAPPSDPSKWKLPRLRIDRDGAWHDEDGEITHPGIVANLQSGLARDEQGHYLQAGPVRIAVEVEDAPFVAIRVEPEGERLVLTLNDLSREPLAVETLRLDEQGIPRCAVKGGRFTARLSRAATYQLLQHAEHDDEGQPAALVIGGARHPLAPADPRT